MTIIARNKSVACCLLVLVSCGLAFAEDREARIVRNAEYYVVVLDNVLENGVAKVLETNAQHDMVYKLVPLPACLDSADPRNLKRIEDSLINLVDLSLNLDHKAEPDYICWAVPSSNLEDSMKQPVVGIVWREGKAVKFTGRWYMARILR